MNNTEFQTTEATNKAAKEENKGVKDTIVKVLKNKFFWFIVLAYFIGTVHGVKTIERPVEKRVEVPVEKIVYKDNVNLDGWKSLKSTDDRLLGVCAEYIGSSSKVFTATSEYIDGSITANNLTKVVEREAGNMNNYNDQIETLGDRRSTILEALEQ